MPTKQEDTMKKESLFAIAFLFVYSTLCVMWKSLTGFEIFFNSTLCSYGVSVSSLHLANPKLIPCPHRFAIFEIDL
jgi:hypothetical protein